MLPGLKVCQKILLEVWIAITTATFFAAYILSKRRVCLLYRYPR